MFGIDKTPKYPGYFQQDPETRGTLTDFITGKTRKQGLEQFRVDEIEKDSNISGVEDPSDYLARKRKEEGIKSLSKTYQDIGRNRDNDPADRGIGPGGSGSRRGASDISDRNRGSYATDDTASFF